MKKYAQERYKAFMANIADRPYWQWEAVADSRTCSKCKILDEKVFYYNDPIWQKSLPPIYKGCRCSFRAYDKADLKEKGLSISNSINYLTLLKETLMPRAEDAVFHLNWAREAERNRDFLYTRVEYMKCVESWKQANQSGEYETEFQNATREYEEFVTRDPIYAKLVSVLIPFIKSNPGILQSDISKQFPIMNWAELYQYIRAVSREDISYALYFAAKQGKISRTKKGRSYELYVMT